jgi:hypothetical protein
VCVLAVWVFSESGLSTSLPWCLRPSSIKPIFYWHPIDPCGSVWPLFGVFFGLRCFQPLQLSAWLHGSPCQTTVRLAAPLPCSSRTKSNFPSGHFAPLTDSNRPVSRRSKPSSRSPLIGEQPHPWPLLHGQDGKNRHRGSKPPGRYVLLPATTLLSPG